MMFQTERLSTQVRAMTALGRQVAELKDAYLNQPCVIVTCGPSLKRVSAVRLQRALGGVLTIAVKQAVDVTGPETDFHCWNYYNVAKWGPTSPSTIRCIVEEPTGKQAQFNKYDLALPQVNGGGDLTNSLAFRRDFDDHLLESDPRRPFGPGIMYELVFFLALHLGVSEIVTIGWDIANPGGKNTHFYDQPADAPFFEQGRTRTGQAPGIRSRLPDPIKDRIRSLKSRHAHELGQLYNRNQSLIGETELVAESTAAVHAWLGGHGIPLAVTTDSAFLSADIERLSVDGLFDRLARFRDHS